MRLGTGVNSPPPGILALFDVPCFSLYAFRGLSLAKLKGVCLLKTSVVGIVRW